MSFRMVRPRAPCRVRFLCYALSEREAGSDTASMKTRARRDGDVWLLHEQKSWITNAGELEFYAVLAVTDPDGRRGSNVTAFVRAVCSGCPGECSGDVTALTSIGRLLAQKSAEAGP